MEFVTSYSQGDYTPFPDLCKFVVDYLRHDRIIISLDGPGHNVIKIKPPLVFGMKEANRLLFSIRSALERARDEHVFDDG